MCSVIIARVYIIKVLHPKNESMHHSDQQGYHQIAKWPSTLNIQTNRHIWQQQAPRSFRK